VEVSIQIDGQPWPLGQAMLIDTTSLDSIKASGEIIFQSLLPGTYKLHISPVTGTTGPPDSIITLQKNDSINLTWNMSSCDEKYEMKPCPIHGTKRKVIRVDYSHKLMLSWNSEKEYDRYSRLLQKQGFQSVKNNGKEVLIYIPNEDQNKLLEGTDICDKYLFCTKHKVVFK
jgi:hypothetical protein